jgi:hypothetical protein
LSSAKCGKSGAAFWTNLAISAREIRPELNSTGEFSEFELLFHRKIGVFDGEIGVFDGEVGVFCEGNIEKKKKKSGHKTEHCL